MLKSLLIFCLLIPHLVYSNPLEVAFIELAKKVSSSVVNISTTKEEQDDMVQIFPGYFMPFQTPQISASGSGFIVDEKGLIITNAHVVQNFDKIQVQFSGDSNFYPAKIVGLDSLSDIALLKVSVKKKLIPFKFGDSEKLEVGEWVAAIGNPHGYGHTMTKGIISAVKREIDDLNLFPLLQTDASINPGNSGGPLVNLRGEVVGVNQAIARGAMGISFAIPINNVKSVLEDLKSYGFVRRGFIGVEFHSDGPKGALVTNVISGSPAERAGIKINDRIVSFAGKKISRPKDLPKAVRSASVGKKISLKLVRDGQERQLEIIPQMINKDHFSSVPRQESQKRNNKSEIRGYNISGGFQVAPATSANLKFFNQPDLGAQNPLVVFVKADSPAFKAGLKVGDLLFQINGQRVSRVPGVKKLIRQGKNSISVLRYHRRYDKYLLISLHLNL